jgi:hypothetical protein
LVGDEPLCHGRTRRDLHWLEPRPLGRERLNRGSAPRDVGVAIAGAWSGLGSGLDTSSIALELSGFREIGRPDRIILLSSGSLLRKAGEKQKETPDPPRVGLRVGSEATPPQKGREVRV